MNKDPYEFQSKPFDDKNVIAYTFVSVGKNGDIVKMVAFQLFYENVYNLALVDYDGISGVIDDEVVSDNGDMSQVLSTTWAIMLHFLKTFPEKSVSIHGNSDTKQKLYHRLVANNLLPLKQQYNVFGVSTIGEKEPFDSLKTYQSIIIQPLSI